MLDRGALGQDSIKVHFWIVKTWLVLVRGYQVESRHRAPTRGSFGTMHYRNSWILTPKKK